MRENYETQKVHDEYKDRIRELTQLLKEWEFKYEQKIREMEVFHNSERNEIIKEFEEKEEDSARSHQDTVKRMFEEF